MILGAGRGGFVKRSLKVQAANPDIKFKIYAVDKNKVSLTALERRKTQENWPDFVYVCSGDIRTWVPANGDKAHIIISELLGSFGDNELSPECLIGAETRIGHPDVIMLPYMYRSFIVPAKVKIYFEDGDSPYVVKLQGERRANKPLEVFRFAHPGVSITEMRKTLIFTSRMNLTINSLIGYFECKIINNIGFSTNPDPSAGDLPFEPWMTSWFPLAFPVLKPIRVSKGQRIKVEFVRKFDDNKVWYEWSCAVEESGAWSQARVHNIGGKSYFMPKYPLST